MTISLIESLLKNHKKTSSVILDEDTFFVKLKNDNDSTVIIKYSTNPDSKIPIELTLDHVGRDISSKKGLEISEDDILYQNTVRCEDTIEAKIKGFDSLTSRF